jgi:hypothetical protein
MVRLVIVGNSHVGALKDAWDAAGASHPRHEISFFAAPEPHFKKLRLNKHLTFGLPQNILQRDPLAVDVLTRVNGRTSIDLTAADKVLLHGLAWPLDDVVQLMADFDIDDLRDVGCSRRMSRSAFDAVCVDLANNAMPEPAWRNWAGPPIVLLARAAPAETCLANDDARYQPWRAIKEKPAGSRAVIDAFLDAYEAALGRSAITLVRQPFETLLPIGMTAASYSRNSLRLYQRVPHPDDDPIHMNADYGALCLAAIFAWLDTYETVSPVPIS